MRRSSAVLLVILVLSAVICYLPAAHADEPPSQIINVDYPKTVRAGSPLRVTVQVAYSSKFGMMDVGIWDPVKGVVIQSLVSNATLSGAGRSTFSFNITAPPTIGPWRLTTITRVWLQDAWFLDQAGTYDFTVLVADNAILTLNGVQQGSVVMLDGEPFGVNGSVLAVPVSLGTVHQLEVPSIIAEGPGRRFIFDAWSDGIASNSRNIVLDSSVSISPVYRTQYFLSVMSDLGVGAGQGWYDEDQVAQFGIPSTVQKSSSFLGLLTDTYQFASWSGDSESNLPASTLLMDGPKSVEAKWVHASTNPNVNGIAAVFLFSAVLLGIKAGLTALERRGHHKALKIGRFTVVVILLLLSVASSASLPVFGQLPLPSAASVVNVGDAYWYYWSQPGSDTCILWLGGGVEYSQGGYLINPYEYESFGTIKFLQELAKYYCVVALEKGPYPSPVFENRTIYQELAQGQFSVATQLHQWINSQGYRHVFLIGYSVGTDVAATVATGNPQMWNGSDGLILITAWLPPSIISGAPNLKANLLLLYGHAPNFEPTGQKFYQDAPSEGWHRSAYFHKEFHLLDEMGHEVWSPLKDNTYSPLALGLTVDFIEKSKALQFGQFTIPTSTVSSVQNSTYQLSTIHAPTSVFWGEPFSVNGTVNSTSASSAPVAVIAYNSFGILSAVQFAGGSSAAIVRLVMPTVANLSEYSFSLLVLEKRSKIWQVVSPAYALTLAATGQIALEVDGLIANSNLIFDSTAYAVSPTGQVKIETSKGIHSIEVQEKVDQDKVHGTFIQWSDSTASASRTLNLEENTSLTAVYRTQYYVEVVSPYGSTQGTGWYETNSTIEPAIQPPIDSQQSLAFSYWGSGNHSYGLGDPIRVIRPMTIQAVWVHAEQPSPIDNFSIALLAVSIFIFSVMLILNLKVARKPRAV